MTIIDIKGFVIDSSNIAIPFTNPPLHKFYRPTFTKVTRSNSCYDWRLEVSICTVRFTKMNHDCWQRDFFWKLTCCIRKSTTVSELAGIGCMTWMNNICVFAEIDLPRPARERPFCASSIKLLLIRVGGEWRRSEIKIYAEQHIFVIVQNVWLATVCCNHYETSQHTRPSAKQCKCQRVREQNSSEI